MFLCSLTGVGHGDPAQQWVSREADSLVVSQVG